MARDSKEQERERIKIEIEKLKFEREVKIQGWKANQHAWATLLSTTAILLVFSSTTHITVLISDNPIISSSMTVIFMVMMAVAFLGSLYGYFNNKPNTSQINKEIKSKYKELENKP